MGAGGNLASIAAFKHGELGEALKGSRERWRAVQGQQWQRCCSCLLPGASQHHGSSVGEGRAPSPLLPSAVPSALGGSRKNQSAHGERWTLKGKNWTAQPLCIGDKAGIAESISVTGTELVTVCRRELQLSHNLTQDL